MPEAMNDMAVLLYVSHITGIPLFQIGSDVKDFFNQKRLSPAEMAKVGLITLDVDLLVEYAASLRRHHPQLCKIAEAVLGYGLFPASNIAQREMIFLVFIWHVEMQVAAQPTVDLLCQQHPALQDWLDARRAGLEGGECP